MKTFGNTSRRSELRGPQQNHPLITRTRALNARDLDLSTSQLPLHCSPFVVTHAICQLNLNLLRSSGSDRAAQRGKWQGGQDCMTDGDHSVLRALRTE